MARRNLAEVFLSITTLDKELARDMEPRASAPHRRLDAIKALADAGVPVGVMTAPMIPGLNDHEMEAILEAAAEAGATRAGFTVLRLPLEIKDLFDEWLRATPARPRRARAVADPPDARRRALPGRVRPAHEGRGPDRAAAERALPGWR